MPSKVGGCVPYDSEIPLQGEDLEKLAHVHRRFARDWALLHSLNVKKIEPVCLEWINVRFILIMKFNVEANVNQQDPRVTT